MRVEGGEYVAGQSDHLPPGHVEGDVRMYGIQERGHGLHEQDAGLPHRRAATPVVKGLKQRVVGVQAQGRGDAEDVRHTVVRAIKPPSRRMVHPVAVRTARGPFRYRPVAADDVRLVGDGKGDQRNRG